ncbi:MAG: hypothetical protein KDB27_35745 [Planctomycetales bacterium]|nr:hypothetical protein [Planctomycetales bacterium]
MLAAAYKHFLADVLSIVTLIGEEGVQRLLFENNFQKPQKHIGLLSANIKQTANVEVINDACPQSMYIELTNNFLSDCVW